MEFINDTNESRIMPDKLLVAPMVYDVIGTIMTILFFLSLVENVSVLIVFKIKKELHDKTNIWIIAVVISDLLIVLNAFPVVVVSSFARGTFLGKIECDFDGFAVTVLGTSSIFLLTGLSIQRYLIIMNKRSAKTLTNTKVVIGVVICFSFGMFWGLAPLFGWGSFALEGINISCAPNWRSTLIGDRTYMAAMYICVLFIPLVIIGNCYIRVVFKIWREKQNHSAWIQQRRVKRDIQVTITVAFVILSFLVSWMPYAVVSLLEGVFQIDIQGVSPMLVQLPCLMAKTSCIWNPIVYVCHNSRYRKAYIETFSFLKKFSERSSTEDDVLSTDSKEKSFRQVKTQSEISTV